MGETRAALVNADKRMKALEFRLQEATRLLSEQSTDTAHAREDLRRAVESQQFAQTMLLTFIAFTAGAGLFLTYFKRDR
jgi:hypothetical protein